SGDHPTGLVDSSHRRSSEWRYPSVPVSRLRLCDLLHVSVEIQIHAVVRRAGDVVDGVEVVRDPDLLRRRIAPGLPQLVVGLRGRTAGRLRPLVTQAFD